MCVGPPVLNPNHLLHLQSLRVHADEAMVLLAAVIGSVQLAHHGCFQPNGLQTETSDMYLMCSSVGVGNAGEFLINFNELSVEGEMGRL